MTHIQDKYNEWVIDAHGTTIGVRTPHNHPESQQDQCDRHDVTAVKVRTDYPEYP